MIARVSFGRFRRLFVFLLILPFAPTTAAIALDESATLELLVRTIQDANSAPVRTALMKGMLKGLEGRRNVPAPEQWGQLAKALSKSESETVRSLAGQLSQIFGDTAASERAFELLMDSTAPSDRRRAALGSLVVQRYEPLADQLPDLLEVTELRLDAIRALGVITRDDASSILLARFAEEDPETQRAIIETLATRKDYASALVGGIKSNTVSRTQIPSYIARSLRDILGAEFTDVYGDIPELQKNTSETIAKFRRLLSDDALISANANRGRTVFQKTCGACHLMYGVGGNIGPDLTGSNRANLDYLLLNSVDPSADVPEGYRTQLVQTVDGRVLTGVLAEEDNQRVVLKTVDQPRVVIAKEDIEIRKVSEKSMMPEGQLDQLSRRDLIDLVKYMQTKSQVEAAE